VSRGGLASFKFPTNITALRCYYFFTLKVIFTESSVVIECNITFLFSVMKQWTKGLQFLNVSVHFRWTEIDLVTGKVCIYIYIYIYMCVCIITTHYVSTHCCVLSPSLCRADLHICLCLVTRLLLLIDFNTSFNQLHHLSPICCHISVSLINPEVKVMAQAAHWRLLLQ